MKGISVLTGDTHGVLEFIQELPSLPMRVKGYIKNLPRGKHGIHIHEFGDVTNGCTSAGEHFNPFDKNHGGPLDSDRHLGDLGNIYSKGQRVTLVDFKDDIISLYGPYNILGRSIVIHTMEDDLGKVNNQQSKLTGNSGGRLCCGVIGVKSEKEISI